MPRTTFPQPRIPKVRRQVPRVDQVARKEREVASKVSFALKSMGGKVRVPRVKTLSFKNLFKKSK